LLFPDSIAEELGIGEPALKLGPEIEGFGGTGHLRFAELDLIIASEFKIHTQVGFYEAKLGQNSLGILGYRGFFDSFRVHFNGAHRTFTIGPPKKKRPR
jgi:hypothetical protein